MNHLDLKRLQGAELHEQSADAPPKKLLSGFIIGPAINGSSIYLRHTSDRVLSIAKVMHEGYEIVKLKFDMEDPIDGFVGGMQNRMLQLGTGEFDALCELVDFIRAKGFTNKGDIP